jgi:hypothetical protein
MSVIYLKHPVHGGKVACAELEAQYDEKNGWVRYTPEVTPVETAPVETAPVDDVPNFLAAQSPRKKLKES